MLMLKIVSDIAFAIIIIITMLAFFILLVYELLHELYKNLIVPTFYKIKEYIRTQVKKAAKLLHRNYPSKK